MNRIYLSFFIITSLFAQNALSQSPFIFEKVHHSFGEIKETGGVVSTKFVFKNTGIVPLVITSVDVSCGCTEPEWQKDTVHPGQSGFIKANFDPMGRPGDIDKFLFVAFNNNPSLSVQLNLSGKVIGNLSERVNKFEFANGNLSVSELTFDFGEIIKDKEYVVKIKICNEGDKPMAITKMSGMPDFFKAKHPSLLQPGDTGEIIFSVHKKDLENIWGDFRFQSMLITSDYLLPQKRFFITGKRVEDFSGLSKKERKNAPKIVTEKTSITLGKVKKGGKISGQVQIKNTGKSDLIIRQVHSPCYCLNGEVNKNTIPPGGTAILTLTYDSVLQKTGQNSRGVTIYTNDPKNPEIVVYGSVEVEE
jgi:hypothetical protein